MPAIWNSYSKSDTARRPRRIDARVLRVHEVHQQRRRTPATSTLAKSASTSRAIVDALVGGEERALRLAVGDADDHAVEELAPRGARGPRGRA